MDYSKINKYGNTKVAYHQVKTAIHRGVVIVIMSIRQSFTRYAKPANSILPTDQPRPPITPMNDL